MMPAAAVPASSTDERDSPAASASAAVAPAAVRFADTAVDTVAAAATARDPPTYRAMLEMPEAWPTSAGATAAVDAEDAGPLARPSPIAVTASGSTKAA